ncbi:Golgi pH regulator [Papilio xuthus]|uniref:Golgi pH regulator n=1 Tax=Papilio xuthus TaxID=66420 RepID=A0A194QIU0_PAPXU|nr:Golgi pH regulator [Papilio xuthus]
MENTNTQQNDHGNGERTTDLHIDEAVVQGGSWVLGVASRELQVSLSRCDLPMVLERQLPGPEWDSGSCTSLEVSGDGGMRSRSRSPPSRTHEYGGSGGPSRQSPLCRPKRTYCGGPPVSTDITQLRQEISGLEELSRQLFLEAHDARTMREKIEWSNTFQGKYFNFLGYFFSLYCVWKIFISTINIVFDRVGKKDPVTRGLELLVHWLGLRLDVAFWSQHVSFLLVGCIVLTSIRGLLLTLTKVRTYF